MSDAAAALADGWGHRRARLAPLGEGHINRTYLATAESRERFVLQRINRAVFRDPALLMSNLQRIRDWLGRRAPGLIPELMATRDGAAAQVDAAGEWWRLWRYQEDSRSLGETSDPLVARAAGAAFGRFQRLLADLDGPDLAPTIPGFLELERYLAELDRILAAGAGPRRPIEVDWRLVDDHRGLAELFPPGRTYIHGDCKLNNLLFARSSPEVICVLDLDTVMRGHWAWDFGDLSRSLLMAGGARDRLFAAVVHGFAGSAGMETSAAELVAAPRYLTFMLGVRFLADHLEGDRYFRVTQHGDNLRRAQQQFELLRALEAEQQALTRAAAEGLELAAQD